VPAFGVGGGVVEVWVRGGGAVVRGEGEDESTSSKDGEGVFVWGWKRKGGGDKGVGGCGMRTGRNCCQGAGRVILFKKS